MVLAMGIPGAQKIPGSGNRPPLPAPSLRDRSSASGEGCGGRRWNSETDHLPYAPAFFRYPSPDNHNLSPGTKNRRLPQQPIASPSDPPSLRIYLFSREVPIPISIPVPRNTSHLTRISRLYYADSQAV